ncbi:hypothetical protein C9374_010115 [Naegleria lovaniensis]|uniref:Uncharacterized protein n=1 Tax=Naegleria lovaniensis TaxID=51637 RepID=A0AA88KGQ8_NAELO|nr:uncharacterized protein C9374_010115 [Naegleria lovaniensis]KAG2375111.1 hypothetical protein C9374_010115 [Naegleria lovaniensis]
MTDAKMKNSSSEDLNGQLASDDDNEMDLPPASCMEERTNSSPFNKRNLEAKIKDCTPDEVSKALLEEIEAKDVEIRELKDLVEELRTCNRDIETLFSDDSEDMMELRDKKLIEIAKKNKNIIVKLNKEKARVVALTQQLQKLQSITSQKTPVTNNNNIRHFTSKNVKETSSSVNTSTNGDTDEDGDDETLKMMNQFKEKAIANEKRVKMLREQGEKYKTENMKLRALIQKEVGEDVQIDSLLNNSEGFRGRAQQIYLLKIKVKDLQTKIDQFSHSPQPNSSCTSVNSTTVSPNMETSSTISTLSSVSVDERQRKAIEKLEQERKAELFDLKKELSEKNEEIKQVKGKLEASVARCKNLEKSYNEMKAKQTRMLEKTENDNKYIALLKAELDQAKKKGLTKSGSTTNVTSSPQQEQEIKKLTKELEQKEEIIRYLKNELQTTSKKALESMQLSLLSSTDIKQAGIVDKSGDEEAKLKLTISTIEVEKLRELKKMSQQKIMELEQKLLEANEMLLKERMTNAELERKCHQFMKGEKPIFEAITNPQLEDEIAILRDENEALKQTIEHSKRAKEEEIKSYLDIIDSQKRNYETYIGTLKEKLSSVSSKSTDTLPSIRQSSPQPPPLSKDDEKSSSNESKLLEENEQLKKQLSEIKNMYNSLAFSQQQRKKFTLK